MLNWALETVVSLLCVLDVHHALMYAHTPRRSAHLAPRDWGRSTVPTDAGDVRRVGSPRRRACLADTLCTLGIWSLYLFLRPFITGVLAYVVPFCSSFQMLWLLLMLANRRTVRVALTQAPRLLFSRVVRPLTARHESFIDTATLWAHGFFLFLARVGKTMSMPLVRVLRRLWLRWEAFSLRNSPSSPFMAGSEPRTRHRPATSSPGVATPKAPGHTSWSEVEVTPWKAPSPEPVKYQIPVASNPTTPQNEQIKTEEMNKHTMEEPVSMPTEPTLKEEVFEKPSELEDWKASVSLDAHAHLELLPAQKTSPPPAAVSTPPETRESALKRTLSRHAELPSKRSAPTTTRLTVRAADSDPAPAATKPPRADEAKANVDAGDQDGSPSSRKAPARTALHDTHPIPPAASMPSRSSAIPTKRAPPEDEASEPKRQTRHTRTETVGSAKRVTTTVRAAPAPLPKRTEPRRPSSRATSTKTRVPSQTSLLPRPARDPHEDRGERVLRRSSRVRAARRTHTPS